MIGFFMRSAVQEICRFRQRLTPGRWRGSTQLMPFSIPERWAMTRELVRDHRRQEATIRAWREIPVGDSLVGTAVPISFKWAYARQNSWAPSSYSKRRAGMVVADEADERIADAPARKDSPRCTGIAQAQRRMMA